MKDFTFLDNVTPETAVLEAAAFAVAISKGKEPARLNVLSNFFLVLGDSLALISSKTEEEEIKTSDKPQKE